VQPLDGIREGDRSDAVAFITELIRLQSEVGELSRQLDRIEAEMRQALCDAARDRFEERSWI
jgi:hypothetical protein